MKNETADNFLQLMPLTQVAPVTLDQIMAKLLTIETRLANIEESLEAIDVRVSDISLDTGGGFEIDS